RRPENGAGPLCHRVDRAGGLRGACQAGTGRGHRGLPTEDGHPGPYGGGTGEPRARAQALADWRLFRYSRLGACGLDLVELSRDLLTDLRELAPLECLVEALEHHAQVEAAAPAGPVGRLSLEGVQIEFLVK